MILLSILCVTRHKICSILNTNVELSRKWFIVLNAENTQIVLFDNPNNSDAIDVKMDKPVFWRKKKSSFKFLHLSFSSK